jgi:hypothetical protein
MSPHPSMMAHNRWTFKRHLLPKNIRIDPHQIQNLCKTLPTLGHQMCRRTDRNSRLLVPSSASSGVWASSATPTRSISYRLSKRTSRLRIRHHRSNVPPVPAADRSKSLLHKSLTRRNSRRKQNGWRRRRRNRNELWRRRCRGNKRGLSCRRGTQSCRRLGSNPEWKYAINANLGDSKRRSKRGIPPGQRDERIVPIRRGRGVRLPSMLLGAGMEIHRFLAGEEMKGTRRPGGETGTTTTQCHRQTWVGCPSSRSPLWTATLGLCDYDHGRVRLDCTSLLPRHCGRHMTSSPSLRGRRILCRTSNSYSTTFISDLLWMPVLRCRTTGRHLPCRIFQ